MSSVEVFLAWAAIGLGASIAGWIWPFRRGVSGIAINAGVSISGALAAGLLGLLLGVYKTTFSATSFFFAAAGAILAMTVTHVVWARLVHPHPRGGH